MCAQFDLTIREMKQNEWVLVSLFFYQEHAQNACQKVLACGHQCGGIANEEECLPCLHNCPPYHGKLKQDADDMCMICFTEALSAAPAIQVCVKH